MKKSILFIAMMLLFVNITPYVHAAPGGIELPSPEVFRPDLVKAQKASGGFILVINYVIGIIGLIILANIGWNALMSARKLMKGKSVGGLKDDWIAIGVALLLVILSLTGTWYDIIVFAYEKILLPALDFFKG
ncbi:MAG: hypothetical protein H0Z33_11145 [Bacillaceae bacterium]|nr:hypothetical protein [Bacillaceae bacterium]